MIFVRRYSTFQWLSLVFLLVILTSQPAFAQSQPRAEVKESSAGVAKEGGAANQAKAELLKLRERTKMMADEVEAEQASLKKELSRAQALRAAAEKAIKQAVSKEKTQEAEEHYQIAQEWEQVLEDRLRFLKDKSGLAQWMIRIAEDKIALLEEEESIKRLLSEGKRSYSVQEAEVANSEAKVAEENLKVVEEQAEALWQSISLLEHEAAEASLISTKEEEEATGEIESLSDMLRKKVAGELEAGEDKKDLEAKIEQVKQKAKVFKEKAVLTQNKLDLAKEQSEVIKQEIELMKQRSGLLQMKADAMAQRVEVNEEALKAQQEKASEAQKQAALEKQKAEEEQERARREQEQAEKVAEKARIEKEQATSAEGAKVAEAKQEAAEKKGEIAGKRADIAREKIEVAEQEAEIARQKAKLAEKKIALLTGTLRGITLAKEYELARRNASKFQRRFETIKASMSAALRESEALKKESQLAALKVEVAQEAARSQRNSQKALESVKALQETARLAEEKVEIIEEKIKVLEVKVKLAEEQAKIAQDLKTLLATERVKGHLWERRPSEVSWLMVKGVWNDLANLRGNIGLMLFYLPQQLEAMRRSLFESRSFTMLLWSLSKLLILIGVFGVFLLWGRAMIRSRGETLPEGLFLSFQDKLRVTLLDLLIYGFTPFALFLAGAAALMMFRDWRDVLLPTLVLLLGLVSYKVVKVLIDALFSPQDAQRRLIACSDDLATYFAKHFARLALYTALTVTPILILQVIGYRKGFIDLLWLIFRIGLLTLLLLFAYKKELIISFLPHPENMIEEFLYLISSRFYPLLLIFVISIFALYSLGYVNLAIFLITSFLFTVAILALTRLISTSCARFISTQWLSTRRLRNWGIIETDSQERFSKMAQKVASYLIYSVVLLIILGIWGVDLEVPYKIVTSEMSQYYFWKIVSIILVIVLSVLFLKGAYFLIDKIFLLSERGAPSWRRRLLLAEKGKTLAPLLKNLIRYITIFFAAITILRKLGVDPTPILAGAGVVGLAVGFGAQTLVRDVIAGFFLLFEGLIAVGDVVSFGDTSGVVEEVGLRVTKYRLFSGELRVIPNGEIRAFGNLNRGWTRAIVTVGVAYESDVTKAMRVMERVGREWAEEEKNRLNILDPPEVQGILAFNQADIAIRLVVRMKALTHSQAEQDLRVRIKNAFDEEEIGTPFSRQVRLSP
ncbi:MAG: mechanosensitive ion channel [Candidatus Tectomicrobia bacterium]|nr:mechanosensitive ion channel [Candidatus Tectomicrobia bacterium]